MSTLRVTYLKHQSSSNNTVTFDANNLVTVQGNVSIGSPLGSNGNLTVANNLTVAGSLTVGGLPVGADAPGTILATTNTATPSGYLPCDGSAYLQSSGSGSGT